MRLLVIEDDPAMRDALERGLQTAGFQVDAAADGHEALLFAADRRYDAIVLDRRLPGLSGDQVLARLRGEGNRTPVLMLTALDRVSDRVRGLDAGADDYLVKPFAFEELLARIRALVRRSSGGGEKQLGYGDLVLDPLAVAARVGSRQVLLTRREFDLLAALVQAGGTPVPSAALQDAAWPEPWDASEEAVWSHIKNIRRKLEALGSQVRLVNRRGVGYLVTVQQSLESSPGGDPR
ncbi:MAG: response regulator transcription factor [Limnochordaceae bacterium]|nr:response regulator transcription factor [Limnochordaceae bacterium]